VDPASSSARKRRPTPTTVIFDGDDTLWETEPLYDSARRRAAQIASDLGLDGAEFEDLQRAIDLKNVELMGLSPDRFPKSSMEALDELSRRHGTALDASVLQRVYDVSASVFDAPAPLMPSSRRVLGCLQRSNYRLALLTKGDLEVQRMRVVKSGLSGYFERIEIVPTKSSETFLSLLHDLGEEPSRAWSVGNSYRSDIEPALRAGLSAIWIDAHVWGFEKSSPGLDSLAGNLHVAESLSEVPDLLDASLQTAR
jgi:putative hydrolase of the HAD superfamily